MHDSTCWLKLGVRTCQTQVKLRKQKSKGPLSSKETPARANDTNKKYHMFLQRDKTIGKKVFAPLRLSVLVC